MIKNYIASDSVTSLCNQNAKNMARKNNAVSHPAHYTRHPSGVECIEIVQHMSFNLGNAIKYVWRADLKQPKKVIEDLQKAVFYINNEIKLLEAKKLKELR